MDDNERNASYEHTGDSSFDDYNEDNDERAAADSILGLTPGGPGAKDNVPGDNGGGEVNTSRDYTESESDNQGNDSEGEQEDGSEDGGANEEDPGNKALFAQSTTNIAHNDNVDEAEDEEDNAADLKPADKNHVWDTRSQKYVHINSQEAYDLFCASEATQRMSKLQNSSVIVLWENLGTDDKIKFVSNALRQPGKRKLGAGKREREDGSIEIDKELLTRLPDGTYQQPRGPPLKGCKWNATEGVWRPVDLFSSQDTEGDARGGAKKKKLGSGRREREDGCIEVDKSLLIKLADGKYQQPRGPPLKGCKWDTIEGIWRPTNNAATNDADVAGHSAKKKKLGPGRIERSDGSIEISKDLLTQKSDGTWKQPRGPPLKGFTWNAHEGVWVVNVEGGSGKASAVAHAASGKCVYASMYACLCVYMCRMMLS
jgi:hypothetical protein